MDANVKDELDIIMLHCDFTFALWNISAPCFRC